VISSIVTVGNYEYGFFWYLQQDGMIQCEIKATGIVATQARAENEPTEYGKLVAPHLNGIHHQHIFCARLDFDLDDGPNSVTETHTEMEPKGPDNRHPHLRHRAGGNPRSRHHRGAVLDRGQP
jgi:primary-amine oxidase